jgi:hypothetical protein
MRVASAPLFTDGQPVAVSDLMDLPGGLIAYANVTTNMTGITTIAPLTGFSLTFTPQPRRILRISIRIHVSKTAASSSDAWVTQLVKDGIPADTWHTLYGYTGVPESTTVQTLDINPTSVSHTYTVQGGSIGSTGTYASNYAGTVIGRFTIEDIGPMFV